MNVASIIYEIQSAGGRIEVNHGKLRLTAPKPLSDDLVDLIKAHKPELLVTLCKDEESDHEESIHEHLEERAAIMEYDGGLTRDQAETEARKALRVFEYRLTDNPDAWLVLIAPGCDLDEASESLRVRFEKRLIDVKEYKRVE